MKIIVIEDEKIKRITMAAALEKAGYEISAFESPVSALKHFDKKGADLIITDIRMPKLDGFEVLQAIKEREPETLVIMMTAYGTIESAVEAMRVGAYDYITKPFSNDQLLLTVKKCARTRELEEENKKLKKQIEEKYSFHTIIGKSKPMKDLFEQIETVAGSDMTVLIEGESGTGKELAASALHFNSGRKNKPFVKLSCAILSESILESELFGHEKGAFTGAIKEKKGRFELADGGTLFLDDVDDIPLDFQVKLLRVLQEKEFERVGGNVPIKVDVRLICATKVDLREKVEKKEFREDLYYRLNVIPLKLPPLRNRKEDIPLLIKHFAEKINRPELRFSPNVIDKLCCYNWPGNVRQLENIISRISAFAKQEIVKEDLLPAEISCAEFSNRSSSYFHNDKIKLEELIAEFEADAINWALEKAERNQSRAAEILGIKRTTLRDKMKKYNLI